MKGNIMKLSGASKHQNAAERMACGIGLERHGSGLGSMSRRRGVLP
jgi:hypothetical protein